MIRRSDAVWCLVLFDLPVETQQQRREASRFRKLLLDSGYSMVQFSVYGKYSPTIRSNQSIEKFLRQNIPRDGEVTILHLTDSQWATANRFSGGRAAPRVDPPEQLVIF